MGITVTGFARRISWLGTASLVLFVGSAVIFQYNFHLRDAGRPPLLSTLNNYQLCVMMQLGAAICGFLAMRRGSVWWTLVVVLAIVMAVGCFFSEV